MLLKLKSPKATKVKAFHARYGASVRAGDVVFELYDYEEQKILSEIDRAIDENKAKILELNGPAVSDKLNGLKEIAEKRKIVIDAAELNVRGVEEEVAVGQRTLLDVLDARQKSLTAGYQCLQAGIEYEIYRRNTVDALSVYMIVREVLARERTYVEKCASRLSIRAPQSGILRSFVVAGTPVRLGHVLAEIE